MNFSFYIFANPSGIYTQYPDDYLSSVVKDTQSGINGSRLVIKREHNLFHYIFYDQIDKQQYIGLCVLFNESLISKPKNLFSLFKHIIEEVVVAKGVFLKYDQQGNIFFPVSSFSGNVNEINQIRDIIDNEFENETVKYGIKPSKTIYNGTQTRTSISIEASDAQILTLTDKFNTVIIDSAEGLDSGYLEKVIANMHDEKERALTKIAELEKDILQLKKQKKQYGWVAILAFAVMALLIGLYAVKNNLSDEISRKNKEASDLRETISNQLATISQERDSIGLLRRDINSKDSQIYYLQRDLSTAKDSLSELEEQIASLNNELSNLQSALSDIKSIFPLVINRIEMGNVYDGGTIETDYGNTIYSSNTMYLKPKIYYTGLNAESITLDVKLINPNGVLSTGSKSPDGYSFSYSVNVSKGTNSVILSGWGGDDKGHWSSGTYRLEVWYRGVCLKVHKFKIY